MTNSKTSETEKLDLASLDVAAEKRAELLRLFPEARTEGGKIDFAQLERALGETVDPGKERYGLNWPGKADCFKTIQAPSYATLRPVPDKSVNFDATENLIIEGDNLEVLKLLQKSYLGQIKMIYIDPPYNTGNDFVYPDDYADSLKTYLEYTGQTDKHGAKFGTNAETDGRFHSKWLNMMYSRLYLARNLLHKDGSIFVSIDERELSNLKTVLNDVFGEECFVAAITVLCNPKGRSQDKYFATNHEYVVVYSKEVLPKGSYSLEKDEAQITEEYTDEDEGGKFRLLELRNTHREFGRHNRKNLFYPFYVDEFGEVFLEPGQKRAEVLPLWDDGFEGCWTWDSTKAKADIDFLAGKLVKDRWKIYRKSYAGGAERMLKTIFLNKEYYTERGQKEFNRLFDTKAKLFQAPKSPYLIRDLIRTCTEDGDIVLDFFAGAGTTAQSVAMLNSEEKTNRHFVLVQLPEPVAADSPAAQAGYETISEITRERATRALKAVADNEVAGLKFDQADDIDFGFRAFSLDKSNFKPWNSQEAKDVNELEEQLSLHVDNLRASRDELDFLFEMLMKDGYPLTCAIEKLTFVGDATFSVSGGVLVICLDRLLSSDLITAIAEKNPERVIFLDEGFAGNDQLKTNAVQTFKAKNIVFRTV